MTGMPKTITMLNADLTAKRKLSRLDHEGEICSKRLAECDYDELIRCHSESLAEALSSAGLIAHDSTLLHLPSVSKIDVLFAEVQAEVHTFRRFVIVEDKLFRNPEAHRDVLSQLMDYARQLRAMQPEALREEAGDLEAWFDGNEDLIAPCLRRGSFLLVIAGDTIRPRLLSYLNHLKEIINPTLDVKLALVAMAVYSDGVEHVLVPHVVGAMTLAERPLTVNVTVKSQDQKPLEADVEALSVPAMNEAEGRAAVDLEALLHGIESRRPADRKVAEELFDLARGLGADIVARTASASVRVLNQSSGRPCTLFVVTINGTFYIGFTSRWEENAHVEATLAEAYDRELTAVLGRSPRMKSGDMAGREAVPLSLVEQHQSRIAEIVRRTAEILRG